ncbi:hypothetical protein RBB78_07365 [Tunturiibacter empetritectus]|uniref:hypothetical protein n=1 Tax=Tunturiibacter empetritectus TaxID=3069691 RepID=UPI003D9BE9E5
MGDVGVLRLGHAGRGDAETEEAGVVAGEVGFDGGVVEEICVHEFAEFGVMLAGWAAADGEDLLYVEVQQALT